MTDNSVNTARLKKLFDSTIKSDNPLARYNHLLFIDAVCSQPNPVATAQRLRESPHGLSRLSESLTINTSDSFLNGHASKLIDYILDEKLVDVESGVLLQAILRSFVEPSLFWNAFQKAFQNKALQPNAELSFAVLLLRLLSSNPDSYVDLAKDSNIINPLLNHTLPDVRAIAYKIQHITTLRASGKVYKPGEVSPGGRHDNDFVDFRQISILPTAEELQSKKKPFLRPSAFLDDPKTKEDRTVSHIDNQFRLLREDLLYEMREEIDVVFGNTKRKHRGLKIEGLELHEIVTSRADKKSDGKTDGKTDGKPVLWGIAFQCLKDPWPQAGTDASRRKKYFEDNSNILKHQSLSCLVVSNKIVAFPSIFRDESKLAAIPPVIVLQLSDVNGVKNTLAALYNAKRDRAPADCVQLLQINTAVFAYEPILQSLKEKQVFPLNSELLLWERVTPLQSPDIYPKTIVRNLLLNPQQDLQGLLKTGKSIILDDAQHKSLVSSLKQRVSLIQGPPGTGKSFIGALVGKILHDHTAQKILVVCYTNHALDQFLEDLLDIGIPSNAIIRLGGKSTKRTEPLSLQKQAHITRFGGLDHSRINSLKAELQDHSINLKANWQRYLEFDPSRKMNMVLEYLQFCDPEFYDALSLPEDSGADDGQDGMKRVGKGGKKIQPDYLIWRWKNGNDAGMFAEEPFVTEAPDIWKMPAQKRKTHFEKWEKELFDEMVEGFVHVSGRYNETLRLVDDKFAERDAAIIASKRIIGCTTTGAAKYRKAIEHAHPNVLLVEEAGEILESHVLTALGESITQLILIGDHKQLRPKVNNYLLTVEKGEGYDLNRSLFERLVLADYPHCTLQMQHRMRPEISQFVRELTYPELRDAPRTNSRPNLRGVQSNIVFINHEHPEDEDTALSERRDPTLKTSKRNNFEANMVLKIVRYLAQQGYNSGQLVVLTPYLGQLRNLRDVLKKENDPILNDLDTHELVQAGLLSSAAASITKKPLRLATIDNYQGEESDIVIISLTRSNAQCDIGFMSSMERLTVLLSRARDAMIMIGNMNTFKNSRSGKGSWSRLFDMLLEKKYLFDGFPVKCEKHPNRTALIKKPEEFDTDCPDGGCTEPCSVTLNCGQHKCPSKCHQISDHSKIKCERKMYHTCPKKHRQQYICFKGIPLTCRQCEKEAKDEEKRKNEEFEHALKLAEINDKMEKARKANQDKQLAKDRENILRQKRADLDNLLRKPPSPPPAAQSQTSPSSQSSPSPSSSVSASNNSSATSTPTSAQSGPKSSQPITPVLVSASRDIWEQRKRVEGISNTAVDGIMAMTGLEEVKKQVLRIMDKVDTTIRQGASLNNERFNVAMLGNPGTGKTTVARFYAEFLASVKVIPTMAFVETTGSRLSHGGVAELKGILDKMLNSGGGTLFVDEAYQLVSAKNPSGSLIMDYMLAEMENHVGKLLFIFAGYNKEMERFFEHNPGLVSRVPYRLQFQDYTDDELLDMLDNMVRKRWNGNMAVEGGGIRGLYGRIVVRRLGRGRNTPGFGNARSLANVLSRISERQAERVSKERRAGSLPSDFFLSKEDLIGLEPASVMLNCDAWKELQKLIGLSTIKEAVRNLFGLIQTNYQRELIEKKPLDITLNRAFLGSPGTGKTTVAKLYGQILAELGLLSNGELVVKNPADFIGAHIGESEEKTKGILATTVGKVLVIDEAYMLYGKVNNGHGHGGDVFRTAVIDTLVAEIQNVPGEDRCVLLLGYKDQMEEMFQNVNPGLSRRFSIENAFMFEDYTESELLDALEFKLQKQDLTATDTAKTVAMEVLSRMKNRPNFGNIGAVENLLSQAKLRFQARIKRPIGSNAAIAPFEPSDFDPDYKRGESATVNLRKLFEDVIGADPIIQKLEKWQTMAANLKKHGLDMRKEIPTTFVFKGPPGTGKTTTARKIGHVYYDMGFLSSSEVVECSASDLVGEYVGHTGPKTKKLFEKALGRVLFIDEAYRLRQGHFASEAIDELVGLLTQDRFRGKLIVILAGYDKEINDLLAVNPGLSSRFPEEVVFPSFSSEHCLQILRKKLQPKKIQISALENPNSPEYHEMVKIIEYMTLMPSWGNARDMETLSKNIITAVFSSVPCPGGQDLTLSDDAALECFRSFYRMKRERENNVPSHKMPTSTPPPVQIQQPPQLTPPPAASSSAKTSQPKPPPEPEQQSTNEKKDERDPGVPDDVWIQLQADKEKQDREEKRLKDEIEATKREEQRAKEALEKAEKISKELAKKASQDKAEEEERLRRLEEASIKEFKERMKQAELEIKRKKAEEQQRKAAEVQVKLRHMGVCPRGFRWTKVFGGYRCAGGYHFVPDSALQ